MMIDEYFHPACPDCGCPLNHDEGIAIMKMGQGIQVDQGIPIIINLVQASKNNLVLKLSCGHTAEIWIDDSLVYLKSASNETL